VLEDALEDFDGTILTVSHDRYFINRVANRVVEMTKDGAKEYIGNYDDYLEKKRLEEAGIEEEEFSGKTKTQIDKEKRKARLAKESAKALKQKLTAAEKRIADLKYLQNEDEPVTPDTPDVPDEPTDNVDDGKSIGTLAIVFIVIGSVAGAAAIGVGVYFGIVYLKRKKGNQ
jgi:ATP-binding cassette subfamily F protein 3